MLEKDNITTNKKTCIFCMISLNKRDDAIVVAENDKALAFLDINPVSDGHLLIITKKHFTNIYEADEESWLAIHRLLKIVIIKIHSSLPLNPENFNVITNMGKIAYQTIFHLHFHVIPKYNAKEGYLYNANPVNKLTTLQVADLLRC